jgi:hypothetical protein
MNKVIGWDRGKAEYVGRSSLASTPATLGMPKVCRSQFKTTSDSLGKNVKIKCRNDSSSTRPRIQLEAVKQHNDLCKYL